VLEFELPDAVDAVVSTATLHWVRDHERLWYTLARALPAERAEEFAAEVVARVRLPLDYVRLNISATRAMLAR
jgi:trans-aconitate methyltransferase